MPAFLDEIGRKTGSNASSIYLPPGISENEIGSRTQAAGNALPEEMLSTAAQSQTGAAAFIGESYNCLVVPPFPLREQVAFTGFETEPLRKLLETDYKIGLVLVHLGSYAVGYCEGDTLITSKVGTGLVHGRNRKGGSSSARFQRRRQNQSTEFINRVCAHVLEHLEPKAKELDYMVYGGPRQTVLMLKKRCPFLKSLEDRELPLLEVPQLRQIVLEKSIDRIWSSCIIEWME